MFETLENRRLFSVDFSGSYGADVAGNALTHESLSYETDQIVRFDSTIGGVKAVASAQSESGMDQSGLPGNSND
ncbi:MAG: hypothetical protein ACREJC_17985 [Tepidisphaeraceae bacterium]